MSIAPRPPIPSLIPESAPFTPEQRTWLNGLFAGMIALEESVTPLSNEQAAKLLPDLLERGAPAQADDGAPAISGAGSTTAPTSIFAVTPCAWRRMSNAR